MSKYIEMAVGTVKIYTFPMYVKDLVKISYVAVRGRDEEEGAVEIVLTEKTFYQTVYFRRKYVC